MASRDFNWRPGAARRLRATLLASSALSTVALAMLLAGPQAALAACDVTGSATPSGTNSVSCAANTTTVVGTNTNGATASSNANNQVFDANGDVSAGISAGVTVGGEGLLIQQQVVNGALTFNNDGTVSNLTCSNNGLGLTTNGGLLTYSGNGNVTGTVLGNGLSASSTGGSLSINTGTGTITGGTIFGLAAATNGAGTLSVTTSGTVSGGARGINTQAADGLTTINVNGGSVTGIQATSYGAGGVQINVNAGSVAAGTFGLHIDSASTGTIDVSIAAGATVSGTDVGLRIAGGGTGAANITVLGTLSGGFQAAADFRGTLNVGTGGTSGALSGDVSMQDSTTLLRFNRSDAVSFGGDISGAGALEKLGADTLTLSGTSTYTGATTVSGGTLAVNGSIGSSAVTVNAGTTLAGTGTVGSTTIASGATLAPGNSIGTLTVQGNLTFNAGSSYTVEFSPTAADRTNVTGTAALTGGTVQAIALPGSFRSQTYTILNATGGFGGTQFAGLNVTGSSLSPGARNPHLTYDANNVFLVLDPGTIQIPAGIGGNQAGVAGAINNFVLNGGAPPAGFDTLLNLTGAQLDNALGQVSGQPGASTSQAGFAATGQFINGVFDGAFGDGPGQGGAIGFAQDDDEANAYAAKRKVSREAKDAYAAMTPRDRRAPSFDARWNVWASVYGGNSRVSGDVGAGTNTATSRIFGTVAGASYRFTPDTLAGFALGGAGSSFDVANGFGGGKSDVFNVAVYAKHTWGAAYVAGLLGYSWQNTSTDRTVTISGTDKLHASFKAQALAARLEGGWRYATPSFGITPYAALQTTTFFLPSYGETATSGSNTFALNYASKTVTATRSELGAKFDKAMLVQGGVFTLKAKTAWAHDWNTDRSATATFQALPGATFTTNGAQPSANAALVSLGGEMKWHNGWSFAANVDGEFSRTTAGYAGKGTIRYAW